MKSTVFFRYFLYSLITFGFLSCDQLLNAVSYSCCLCSKNEDGLSDLKAHINLQVPYYICNQCPSENRKIWNGNALTKHLKDDLKSNPHKKIEWPFSFH